MLEPLAAEVGAQALVVRPRRSASDVERLAGEAGEVDVLVANAALPASGLLTELTQEQIDRMLEVNLRAPIALARALAPGMVEPRPRPHGVHLLAGRQGGLARLLDLLGDQVRPARASRSGCVRTCARDGVGVSVVLPGFIRDAGMFAEAGIDAAARSWARATPEQVAAGRHPGGRAQPGRGGRWRRSPLRLGASFAARGARGWRPRSAGRWAATRSRSTWPRVSATSALRTSGRGAGLAVVPAGCRRRASSGCVSGVLARHRGQRGDDLVGQLGAVDRALGRGLDPDDDVVAVDLLQEDRGRGAGRRRDLVVEQRLNLAGPDAGGRA